MCVIINKKIKGGIYMSCNRGANKKGFTAEKKGRTGRTGRTDRADRI